MNKDGTECQDASRQVPTRPRAPKSGQARALAKQGRVPISFESWGALARTKDASPLLATRPDKIADAKDASRKNTTRPDRTRRRVIAPTHATAPVPKTRPDARRRVPAFLAPQVCDYFLILSYFPTFTQAKSFLFPIKLKDLSL